MNNNYRNDKPERPSDDFEVISFDKQRRQRAEQIRSNEEEERRKRRIQQQKLLRAERIRKAKIERMKAIALLGAMAVGAVCVVIAIIAAIVGALTSPKDEEKPINTNKVSSAETALVGDFVAYDGIIYSENNDFLTNANAFIGDIAMSYGAIPTDTKKINEFGALSEQLIYAGDPAVYEVFRETVKNAPIFSNGYVWSETDSMKSTVTGGYLYDTNTSYITAIANICLYEGSTAFLNEIDTDSQPQRDKSQGKTVAEKLNMAINYLFDGNIADGGIKFDTISSLCYIHTADNNGLSNGYPSNRWFNFRFGYLDAYSNIVFNRAMQKVSLMYTLAGQTDEASRYSAVVKANAEAFSEKFWDSEKMRFVGCFDKDGTPHDYGFVFVNLEAIEAGMANDEQVIRIFTWLDGTRTIDGDTSTGGDIYAFGFAPRNTTVSAEDKWWDYLGGTLPLSTTGAYGEYYQNGGASLSQAYYDIMARYTHGDTANAQKRINALISEYKNGRFSANDNSSACEIDESVLSRLAPTAVLKTAFGINKDGMYLTVSPNKTIIGTTDTAKNAKCGVKNVRFANNGYGFLYDSGKLYITADSYTAVRINAGGLEPGAVYDIIKVRDGEMLAGTESLTADSNGSVAITTDFGGDIYIKVQPSGKK